MSGSATMGLCLDIDGTLYRDGSVFVETLVHLPFVRPHQWSATDRRRLRRAVGVVGGSYGSARTERRWRLTLGAVELLRRVGGRETAIRALRTLRQLEERADDLRSVAGRRRSAPSADGYGSMRASLLDAYGSAIAGHRRSSIRDAAAATVEEFISVDPPTMAALRDLSAPKLDIALVTDMPEHVAEAFASVALDVPIRSVAATRFETDGAGRFGGGYGSIDKERIVAALRDRCGWDHVVAAGDTVRDLGMRAHADRFVAVAGQGRIDEALDPPFVDAREGSPRDIRTADAVYVPSGYPLGRVLRHLGGR